MKVVALKKGFFDGKIQREGAEFTVEGKEHLGNWMQVIEEPKEEKPKPKPKKLKVKKEEFLSDQE